MVMIAYSGCSNSTEQSAQGESQLEVAMNALVFTDANAKGKVKNNEIKWEHVLGERGCYSLPTFPSHLPLAVPIH